jgi:hypothetical protein
MRRQSRILVSFRFDSVSLLFFSLATIGCDTQTDPYWRDFNLLLGVYPLFSGLYREFLRGRLAIILLAPVCDGVNFLAPVNRPLDND